MASRNPSACPSEEHLFRFSTGDASPRDRVRLQQHIDLCAACAERLRDWESTTAAYRAYVEQPLQESGAGDLAGLANETDRPTAARFAARLRREPLPRRAWFANHLRPGRWASIAAVLLLLVGGLAGWLPTQTTVTADELVARAVESDDRQGAGTPPADVTIAAMGPARANVAGPAAARAMNAATRALMSERGAHARELEQRLSAYAFDWQAPLSARPYQQWRAATSARTDSWNRVDDQRVRVSTRAAAGRIERAELTLRTADYRPVGQLWRFSDGFEVELQLFERGALAASSAAATAPDAAAATTPVGSPGEMEIALRLSLERGGVVLTRHLTIRRNRDQGLTINGRASPRVTDRIAGIVRSLGDAPIAVRLRPSTASDAGDISSASSAPGLTAWLDRTYGARPARAAFLPRAFALREQLRDAAATLGDLGERYPDAATIDGLSAASRRDLQRLIGAYYARVTSTYESLESHLGSLTGSISRAILPAAAPRHWRALARTLTPGLEQLTIDLDALAAPADDVPADADAFERVFGARLRASLAAVVPR